MPLEVGRYRVLLPTSQAWMRCHAVVEGRDLGEGAQERRLQVKENVGDTKDGQVSTSHLTPKELPIVLEQLLQLLKVCWKSGLPKKKSKQSMSENSRIPRYGEGRDPYIEGCVPGLGLVSWGVVGLC